MVIRPAEGSEAKKLTDLAIQSEAYWDYDSVYMEKFAEIYKITEDFLSRNPTFVLIDNDLIIGFYSVLVNKEENSLEYFYINPRFIGKGYGKVLFEHLKEYCGEKGLKEVFLVTSPQAKDFYVKMGASYIGDIESLLKKGRMIPKLKFVFEGVKR